MSGSNWQNAGTSQENNATEDFLADILRDHDANYKKRIQLETCGPSSIEAIGTALTLDIEKFKPLQFSDAFTLALNDSKIVPKKSEWDLPVNRYIEAYPYAIKAIFGDKVEAWVVWYSSLDKASLIREYMSKPDTCIMCSLVNPGHYIGVLNIEGDKVFYNESWLDNYWNYGTERIRSIDIHKLAENVKYGFLVVRKKG